MQEKKDKKLWMKLFRISRKYQMKNIENWKRRFVVMKITKKCFIIGIIPEKKSIFAGNTLFLSKK